MPTAIPAPCDESLARSIPSPKGCTDRRATLLATILGSSLAIVVGTIINVALPAMQRDFGLDAAGAQWIVNAYLLPLGALVLIGGALGDHYGRKPAFLAGLAVFCVGCLVCALAPSFPRAARRSGDRGRRRGFARARNSLAIISASFPRSERGAAIGHPGRRRAPSQEPSRRSSAAG